MIMVDYEHAKEKEEVKKNDFAILFNRDNTSQCFTTRVKDYIFLLKESAAGLPDDALFHKPPKHRCGHQVMGTKYLALTGKLLVELGVDELEANTGHCFQRTAATVAANAGANTMGLKHPFGWKQEATALQYATADKERQITLCHNPIMTATSPRRVRKELKSTTWLFKIVPMMVCLSSIYNMHQKVTLNKD